MFGSKYLVGKMSVVKELNILDKTGIGGKIFLEYFVWLVRNI